MEVLVVDDHALFRRGLSLMLAQIFDGVSVTEAGSADEAIELVSGNVRFDLVLLDLVMPGMSGYEGLKFLHQALPDVPIVVVSASEGDPDVRKALACGARGYVLKSAAADVLMHALPLVLSGEIYVPSAALRSEELLSAGRTELGEARSLHDPAINELTPRQTAVLTELARGRSNKEIARSLGMLEGTVKVHVKAIFSKLGVRNRTQAVVVGAQRGHIPRHLVS